MKHPDNDASSHREFFMLKTIREVAFDKIGKYPSHVTQWRWLHKGVRGVKLNAKFINGRWMTTAADFDAFASGQTEKRLETEAEAETEQKLRAAGLI